MKTISPRMVIVLLVVRCMPFLNACTSDDLQNEMLCIAGNITGMGFKSEAADVYAYDLQYLDEKTGHMISRRQYLWNDASDKAKRKIYIAFGSFAIGFLIRRLSEKSVTMRKMGLILEIPIPILYIMAMYMIAWHADHLI
jgi:hypothetical protein